MSTIINAEHFEISDENRAKIEERLDRIFELVPEDATLRLFIKKNQKAGLSATLTVHIGHDDIVSTGTGNELFKLLASVKAHMVRQLTARKGKKIDSRRRPTSSEVA